MSDKVSDIVLLGAVLSTSVRVRILYALREFATLTLTQLAGELDASLGSISHHVAIMKAARVVVVERSGREKLVSLGATFRRAVVGLLDEVEDAEGGGDGDEVDEGSA